MGSSVEEPIVRMREGERERELFSDVKWVLVMRRWENSSLVGRLTNWWMIRMRDVHLFGHSDDIIIVYMHMYVCIMREIRKSKSLQKKTWNSCPDECPVNWSRRSLMSILNGMLCVRCWCYWLEFFMVTKEEEEEENVSIALAFNHSQNSAKNSWNILLIDSMILLMILFNHSNHDFSLHTSWLIRLIKDFTYKLKMLSICSHQHLICRVFGWA